VVRIAKAKAIAKTKEKIQPEVNIGLVGHVDHGKTTLTEALTGRWTDTHSEELRRGITIRLGYADAVLRKCSKCGEPDCYTTEKICPKDKTPTELVRVVSFVDAPGHESLMATMLSGSNIMDGALLLIAANESCPQPQTQEHLMALEIIGIKNVVIVQNKIDLVTAEQAKENHRQIKEFIKGSAYENAPIVPISAQARVNIDVLIKTIADTIPVPERNPDAIPIFLVARSFDINRPGTEPLKLQGGVLGGALKQGTLKVGDEIEISPGIRHDRQGKTVWEKINARIVGLKTGGESVAEISPGGSAGILTKLDPSIVKSDAFSGAIVSYKDKTPPVWYELALETKLLDRVVGSKDKLVVEPLKKGEPLMLNVNSAATVGLVQELSKNKITVKLKLPVCADVGARVTISRNLGQRWRLIGYGVIQE